MRPDRRKFLTTAALAAGLVPFVGCGRTLTGPSFGVVADPQYADIPDRGRRSYRASVGRLTEAVADFNRRDLDFCVNLGDAIDRDWGSFDAILAPDAYALVSLNGDRRLIEGRGREPSRELVLRPV